MGQRLGQHFLTNKKMLERIADAVVYPEGGVVIEIGPGKGALTEFLVERAEKAGANVFAIEKDRELASILANQLKVESGKLKVIEGDALRELPKLVEYLSEGITEWIPASAGMTERGASGQTVSVCSNEVLTERVGKTVSGKKQQIKKEISYSVVGNIPYYISGYLFRVLGELKNKPQSVVLLIQREVAMRVTAKKDDMNLLAAAVQFWADTSLLFKVPSGQFSPPPDVDSAVVGLLSRKKPMCECSHESYYSFIRSLFKQPRKTVLNNLISGDYERARVERALTQHVFSLSIRPHQLSLENICTLLISLM